MEIARLVLEYLKVFLSAPIVIGIVSIIVIWIFRMPLSEIISRTGEVEFPGGAKWKKQAQPLEKEEILKNLPETPKPPLLEVSKNDQRPTVDQIKTLTAQLSSESARATIWEYRYLNLFLAPITLEVLQNLSTMQKQPTVELLNTLYLKRVPNQEQRRAILTALEAHDLVNAKDGLIEVSDKGRSYLQWKQVV